MPDIRLEILFADKTVLSLSIPFGGLLIGGDGDAEITLPHLRPDLLCRVVAADAGVEWTRLAGALTNGPKAKFFGDGETFALDAYVFRVKISGRRRKDPTKEFVFQPESGALLVRSFALAISENERDAPRCIDLPEGCTVIGKDPSCDVVISDSFVSTRHLAIEAHRGRVAWRDLGSRNGTWTGNGKSGAGELLDGQSLRIGKTAITLRAATSKESLPKAQSPIPGFIGESESVQNIASLVRRVAPTDVTILIEGETGTGKELIARGIHLLSERGAGPFIPVNCGAIPRELFESELFGHVKGAFSGALRDRKGLFAVASGGTIFLDEIGELPMEAQVRLLRVLDDFRVRPVGSEIEMLCNVRVIAATNRDLDILTREGKFRKDLLYRLRMIGLNLPPLRERGEDIVLLAGHFLRTESAAGKKQFIGFTDGALEKMREYGWPGNVRELKACVIRAVLLGDGGERLDAGDLSLSNDHPQIMETLENLEKDAIRRALAAEKTREQAARRLGIAVSTLYEKIKKYGLN
jgi:DNA-binding NtrC family response regulator